MFKNKFILLILILMLIIPILTACKGEEAPKDDPASAYWAYYAACQERKFETARSYLTEDAQQRATSTGVCSFTHDAVNEFQPLPDGSDRTFSADPEVIVEEDKAAMTWLDDQGNVALILLRHTDTGWKITEITWSN